MKAVSYLNTSELEQSLRTALRLRWPEAEISCVDSEAAAVDAASRCDVTFVDGTSPSLIKAIRAGGQSGIIVLSVDPSDEEMLDGLEAGADDYLNVPLSATLVVAKVGALLRRVTKTVGANGVAVRLGSLDIRPGTHQAYLDGEELRLTPTEFNLLNHLAAARGGTMTSKALQKLIWECDEPLYLDTLRKYVQRLRKKLNGHAGGGVAIVAVRGVGYRLAYGADANRSA